MGVDCSKITRPTTPHPQPEVCPQPAPRWLWHHPHADTQRPLTESSDRLGSWLRLIVKNLDETVPMDYI